MTSEPIPAEVMEKAYELAVKKTWRNDAEWWTHQIARAIHEAVLAERERCAEVAFVQAKQGAAAEQIAAAIRAGESHE